MEPASPSPPPPRTVLRPEGTWCPTPSVPPTLVSAVLKLPPRPSPSLGSLSHRCTWEFASQGRTSAPFPQNRWDRTCLLPRGPGTVVHTSEKHTVERCAHTNTRAHTPVSPRQPLLDFPARRLVSDAFPHPVPRAPSFAWDQPLHRGLHRACPPSPATRPRAH